MNANPLLEPGNHALLLIDHQYLQLLTLRSHEASQAITNATAVAKAAKIFDVPTLLTTAFAERQNSYQGNPGRLPRADPARPFHAQQLGRPPGRELGETDRQEEAGDGRPLDGSVFANAGALGIGRWL